MEKTLNAIKQFEYTEILGWSVSRYDKFALCKRQYYYDYYGKYDTEFPRSRITALKKMTSVPLESGNIVHDTLKVLLERLLKTEEPINTTRFMEYARRKTDEYCNAKTFAEVHYGEKTAVKPEEVYAGVKICLENFLHSPRFTWITTKAVTNKSGWVIEPPGFGETRIAGFKAYCKVDFLFPVDGVLHILDWKTGRRDEKKHKKQLIGYSTWAAYHFGKTSESIVPMVAYLQPAYGELQIAINEFDMQEFTSAVEEETKQMYGFCHDTMRNIPKAKDEFPKVTTGFGCRFCNYKELCKVS